jgi:hypothetical protein
LVEESFSSLRPVWVFRCLGGERGGPLGDRGTVPGESVAGMAVLVIATAVVGLLAVLAVRMVWRHQIIQLRGRFR